MSIKSDNPTRKSWSLPPDCKEEIREMYRDGLRVASIAWYIGVTNTTVRNLVKHGIQYETHRRSFNKNRERNLLRMREYSKKRSANKKKESQQLLENLSDAERQKLEALKRKL